MTPNVFVDRRPVVKPYLKKDNQVCLPMFIKYAASMTTAAIIRRLFSTALDGTPRIPEQRFKRLGVPRLVYIVIDA